MECDCWSLTCDIRKKQNKKQQQQQQQHKTKKKDTFAKRIVDKTNSYINEKNSATLDIEIEQKK